MGTAGRRGRRMWAFWQRARWVLVAMVVVGLGFHLYYSIHELDLPTYRSSFKFEYETLNGHNVADMTPAEIEQNLTLPKNGTASHAKYTNFTVPPSRTMYNQGEPIEVPFVLSALLQVSGVSSISYEVFLDGVNVSAGAGHGDLPLAPGLRLKFEEFPRLEIRLKNMGNESRVDTFIVVTYEDARFFAPNAMRILLVHAPSAWVGYLGYGVAVGASLLALRRPKWESWAVAGIELSVLFSTIALVTGPLWASAEWLTPWRWEDVKLFVTLVMYLTLIGFLSIRAGIDDPAQRRKMSAYYAVLAFVTVPLSFFANRWWPRDHPAVIENPNGEISDAILSQLIFGFFIITVLFVILLLTRVAMLHRRERIEDAKARLEDEDSKLVADLPVVDEDDETVEEASSTKVGGAKR